MSTMPIPKLPNPLTPKTIEGLMNARPYLDLNHPQSKVYRQLVQRGFKIMYPDTRFDAIGRMIDDPPRPPERIAHLVAEANQEMERGFDERGGAGGAVHVQSHSRDGGKVEVADYWRSRPGSGGSDSGNTPNAENPGDETDDTPRGRDNSKTDDSLPAPDSREPIDPNDFYRKVEFDPNGEKQWEAALRRPLDARRAGNLQDEADTVTGEEYPGVRPHNNEADAFRHAYWSFEVTCKVGPEAAKEFGDAHERSDPNPTPERLMDLYNNKAGRDLALDPSNANRDGREAIREAIRDGKLRTRPFETNEPRSLLPDRAPGLLYRPPGGQKR